MKLNIIQDIKDIYSKKRQLLQVYFTFLPNSIYKLGINSGNFAICGIGLGLLYSRRIFWICNSIIIILYYYKSYVNQYLFYFFVSISVYLIIQSLLKSIYLIKYVPQYFML